MNDLVERNELYYKRFSDVPFTGEVCCDSTGKFREGKKYGKWLEYHSNGQLKQKTSYIDGKRDGLRLMYCKNGNLEHRGTFKMGKGVGLIEIWDCYKNLRQTYLYRDGEERVITWFNKKGQIESQMTDKEYDKILDALSED